MRELLADARLLLGAAWRLNPRRVGTHLGLTLATGLVGGANLLMLIPIVTAVAEPGSTVEVAVVGAWDVSAIPLPALLGAFLVLVAAQSLLMRAATISAARVEQQIVDELRQEAFDAVLAARWTYVLTQRSSDIIEVVTTGAYRCGLAYEQLLRLAITAVLAVATTCVALVVSPVVTLLALAGALLLGAVLLTSVRTAHRLGEQFSEHDRHLQGVMIDSMGSLRLIRAHDAPAVWAGRLAAAFSGTREVEIAQARRQATVSAAAQVGLAAGAALLVLVAVWREVPAASIAVILILLARLARQVQAMAATAATAAYALPAVRDLTGLTESARAAAEAPPGAVSTRPALAVPTGEPLLEFQDVTFTYPQGGGVRQLSLTLRSGEVTVLTGPSGSGKSTTADLALGLLQPTTGRILVAGTELVTADLAWWRRHVAYVPQETVLVPGTLRDNLTWSVPRGVSDERCWQALDQASAAFARALPDGLDTQLGDRGLRLSGGERQRVAIARALLRDPALLVLDEATSALDDRTESAVLDVVEQLVPAVTVLLIAHRRSTAERAQHVVELASGRAAG